MAFGSYTEDFLPWFCMNGYSNFLLDLLCYLLGLFCVDVAFCVIWPLVACQPLHNAPFVFFWTLPAKLMVVVIICCPFRRLVVLCDEDDGNFMPQLFEVAAGNSVESLVVVRVLELER